MRLLSVSIGRYYRIIDFILHRHPSLVPNFNGSASSVLSLNMLSDESFGEKFGHRMFVLLLACVNRILSNVLHLLG